MQGMEVGTIMHKLFLNFLFCARGKWANLKVDRVYNVTKQYLSTNTSNRNGSNNDKYTVIDKSAIAVNINKHYKRSKQYGKIHLSFICVGIIMASMLNTLLFS